VMVWTVCACASEAIPRTRRIDVVAVRTDQDPETVV
jgi:hypothetical protein